MKGQKKKNNKRGIENIDLMTNIKNNLQKIIESNTTHTKISQETSIRGKIHRFGEYNPSIEDHRNQENCTQGLAPGNYKFGEDSADILTRNFDSKLNRRTDTLY